MYHSSDPRAALAATPAKSAPAPTQFAGADYAKFYEMPPTENRNGTKTWYARGQNFVIAYSQCEAGATFSRKAQVDEYVLLIPNVGDGAEITWNGATLSVTGHTVTFIPPGDSTITIKGKAEVIRMVTTRSPDMAALCSNAESYATAHPNIPPFEAWPDAPAGAKVRSYSLDVAPEPGRFGRIWRCSTFMVNYLDPRVGPREPTQMSPHHHDDFEQCSLCLEGTFVHHLRWPWTPDMTQWREDEHVSCGAPSIAVIPPPSIHTSQAMEQGVNQLVDIFCPPRVDFSLKKGWVLNSDEYPLPQKNQT